MAFLVFGLLAFFTLSAPAASLDGVLSGLREAAIRKSPDLRLAQETVRQKRAQALTSWTRWLPRVDFQLSQNTRRDLSLLSNGTLPTLFTGFLPPEAHYGEWAFNASMPLYRRSVHLAVEQAAHERDLAERQLDQSLDELDWRLHELIGHYLVTAYKVEALKSSLEIARSNLKDTELRFNLGERTRIDMLRAKANLVSLESRQLSYDRERVVNRQALLEFSGLDTGASELTNLEALLRDEKAISSVIDDFAALEHVLTAVAPYLGEGDIADNLLRDRIEARLAKSASLRAAVSEAEVSASRARTLMSQEWPELALQGSVYKLSRDWGQLFTRGNESYFFGVVLTIPIFSGGSLFTTMQEMHAAQATAEIKREKDLTRLRHEVESERLEIRAMRTQLDSYKLSLDQNAEIVKLSTESYHLGKESEVDLLSSQNGWMDAKINVAETRVNLSVLARRYAASLGVEL